MNKYNPFKAQVGGDWYEKMTIQPVEYIHKNGIGFIEGSIIKYVSRWRSKGGLDDLRKARHFIELLMSMENETTKAPKKSSGREPKQVGAMVQNEGWEDTYGYSPREFQVQVSHNSMPKGIGKTVGKRNRVVVNKSRVRIPSHLKGSIQEAIRYCREENKKEKQKEPESDKDGIVNISASL